MSENLILLLGRLHPLVVHLPIGIFVLLAVLELSAVLARIFPRLPQIPPTSRTLVLLCAALSSLCSVAFGWALARGGDYDATLLDRHELLGTTVALLSLVLLLAHRRGWTTAYRGTLVATLTALVATGHYGGSMTHGADYLSPVAASAATSLSAATNPGTLFGSAIQPILTQRCATCHGPTKSDGALRLDGWAQISRGGKKGPVLTLDASSESPLLERISRPLAAKGHMPPKGKPQLTEDEFALLAWWIETGASPDTTIASADFPPPIRDALARRDIKLPPLPAPADRTTTLQTAAALAQSLQVIIRPLSADTPWLAVNARPRLSEFTDRELAALQPIATVIYHLDLGETAVTDRGLSAIAAMKNLRRLQLDRTVVTDAGLESLASLPQLEFLNLHTTAVSDAGIAGLHPLKRLRSVYVWQTKVTPAALAALEAAVVDRRRLRRLETQLADLHTALRAETPRFDLGAATVSAPLAPSTTASPAPATPATPEARPETAASTP
jgi:mono/diheme cytochrome c family protein